MKIGWMAGGLAGLLVGLGFVCPAVSHWRVEGSLGLPSGPLLLLGLALMAAGGLALAVGVRGGLSLSRG